ncbi:unnamed protein product [Ambrosiozyma monospora]|uniref:Unnamed protein product n=1 Tax=Ambrosiozyma monospora TaxID=43982 RepID=A0A9W6YSH1_AMBMO|nr:unnamed protein product [Ambrosiozyma monospora]
MSTNVNMPVAIPTSAQTKQRNGSQFIKGSDLEIIKFNYIITELPLKETLFIIESCFKHSFQLSELLHFIKDGRNSTDEDDDKHYVHPKITKLLKHLFCKLPIELRSWESLHENPTTTINNTYGNVPMSPMTPAPVNQSFESQKGRQPESVLQQQLLQQPSMLQQSQFSQVGSVSDGGNASNSGFELEDDGDEPGLFYLKIQPIRGHISSFSDFEKFDKLLNFLISLEVSDRYGDFDDGDSDEDEDVEKKPISKLIIDKNISIPQDPGMSFDPYNHQYTSNHQNDEHDDIQSSPQSSTHSYSTGSSHSHQNSASNTNSNLTTGSNEQDSKLRFKFNKILQHAQKIYCFQIGSIYNFLNLNWISHVVFLELNNLKADEFLSLEMLMKFKKLEKLVVFVYCGGRDLGYGNGRTGSIGGSNDVNIGNLEPVFKFASISKHLEKCCINLQLGYDVGLNLDVLNSIHRNFDLVQYPDGKAGGDKEMIRNGLIPELRIFDDVNVWRFEGFYNELMSKLGSGSRSDSESHDEAESDCNSKFKIENRTNAELQRLQRLQINTEIQRMNKKRVKRLNLCNSLKAIDFCIGQDKGFQFEWLAKFPNLQQLMLDLRFDCPDPIVFDSNIFVTPQSPLPLPKPKSPTPVLASEEMNSSNSSTILSSLSLQPRSNITQSLRLLDIVGLSNTGFIDLSHFEKLTSLSVWNCCLHESFFKFLPNSLIRLHLGELILVFDEDLEFDLEEAVNDELEGEGNDLEDKVVENEENEDDSVDQNNAEGLEEGDEVENEEEGEEEEEEEEEEEDLVDDSEVISNIADDIGTKTSLNEESEDLSPQPEQQHHQEEQPQSHNEGNFLTLPTSLQIIEMTSIEEVQFVPSIGSNWSKLHSLTSAKFVIAATGIPLVETFQCLPSQLYSLECFFLSRSNISPDIPFFHFSNLKNLKLNGLIYGCLDCCCLPFGLQDLEIGSAGSGCGCSSGILFKGWFPETLKRLKINLIKFDPFNCYIPSDIDDVENEGELDEEDDGFEMETSFNSNSDGSGPYTTSQLLNILLRKTHLEKLELELSGPEVDLNEFNFKSLKIVQLFISSDGFQTTNVLRLTSLPDSIIKFGCRCLFGDVVLVIPEDAKGIENCGLLDVVYEVFYS